MSPKRKVLRLLNRWQRHPNRPRGACKYEPTCSHYAQDAIREYGLVLGGARTMWRVVRCSPLGAGGYDPVLRGGVEVGRVQVGPTGDS